MIDNYKKWILESVRILKNGRAYLILLLLGCTICVNAQTTISSTQLLSENIIVEGNELMQGNFNFLKNTNQSMPFIEKMEMRTESDEFDLKRQEYLFRMSFNNKKARKIQDGITENTIHLYELKSEILEEAKIETRYELIVDWYYLLIEKDFQEQKKIVLEDKKTVFQKMMNNALVVDVENLLKVEEDIEELEREILYHDLYLEKIAQQLFGKENATKSIALDTSAWISIKTMHLLLNEIDELPANTLAQAFQGAKIDAEQMTLDLEKAESNRILDFVQFKYAGRNEEQVYKEFSLGVGINIPTKAASRIKLNEAALDVFDEKYENELLRYKIEERINLNSDEFELLFKSYQILEQQIANNQMKAILEKHSTVGTVHPLTLLSLQENILKKKRSLRKIEKDACLVFLDIIKYKGLLHEKPFTNFLSDDLHFFQK